MINKLLAVFIVITLIFGMSFVPSNATTPLIRLTNAKAEIKQTEKFFFFFKNYNKTAKIFYLSKLKRLIIETSNTDLSNSVSDTMKTKIANLKKESKLLYASKIIVFNSSNNTARIVVDIHSGVAYSVTNTVGKVIVSLTKKTAATPKPTAKPTPKPTPKLTPKPFAPSTPTPVPLPRSVVAVTNDNTTTQFRIPDATTAQINVGRTYSSDGSGSINASFCSLDNELSSVFTGTIPQDVTATCTAKTVNRSDLNLSLKSWANNLVSYRDGDFLNLKLSPSTIDNSIYSGVLRKAEFRMNFLADSDFYLELSLDKKTAVFSGPVDKFSVGDGVFEPKDGLVDKIDSKLSEDSNTRIVTISGAVPLNFILYKNSNSKYTLINILSDAAAQEKLVILDAGHGGYDPGAVGKWSDANYRYQLLEKDMNLDIILRLDKLLTDAGIRVELSRFDDRYVSLSERYDFANSHNAKLFLSVHQNASVNYSAMGTETYYNMNKGTTPGLSDYQFATNIQNALVKGLNRDTSILNRGVFSESYAVIRETNMTAALTEIEFISNSSERKMIMNPKNRQLVALSIATGIKTSLTSIK